MNPHPSQPSALEPLEAERLRYEQQCFERFDQQARALEQRLETSQQALEQSRTSLEQCQLELQQTLEQGQQQLAADQQQIAKQDQELARLQAFEQRARRSFKTQLKLGLRELRRRLQRP